MGDTFSLPPLPTAFYTFFFIFLLLLFFFWIVKENGSINAFIDEDDDITYYSNQRAFTRDIIYMENSHSE